MIHTVRTLLRLVALGLALAWQVGTAHADSTSLRAQAQADDPTRYGFAVSKGAEFKNTSDNKSFTVWWAPSGTPKGVIVALHGHDSFATDEIYLWQPYAEKYGYAVLALQWWFGAGETTSDYYTPDEMYPIIASRLAEKGVKAGSVMFIGFSRGSANSFAVAALDAAGPAAQHYFGFVFSNSGGAMLDYPPTKAVDTGSYGSRPYAGVNWGLYCGEKDDDPQMSGCPAMSASRDWITRLGANVVLYIDDPNGDHGGFMLNSANVESALATYATLLATPTAPPACTLSASPTSLSPGGWVTLSATCSPAATAYTWSGGTCAGATGATCSTSPSVTTTYTVGGRNAAGSGATVSVTVAVNDSSPPTVPTGLAASAITSSGATLAWTAASDNVGVTGYRVYRNQTLVGSPTGIGFTDSGLSAATRYSYTVAACDAAGNCSAPSAAWAVTTAAAASTPSCTLSASATSGAPGTSLTLTARCTPGATSYAWSGAACSSASSSCSVKPGATTTYSVAGSNAAGLGPTASVTVQVTDTSAPSVPAGLSASALDSSRVQLSWSASTDNVGVTGYRLYRNQVQVASPTATTATDGALQAGTAYSYTVAACDAAGNCSAAGGAVSVTTLGSGSSISNAEADCLFDWGEDRYPGELYPRRPVSLNSAPYYYRRYTGSNSYLGVSSADQHLYFADAQGRVSDLGLAATWSAQARCR